jgi:3-hydroxyisobutyrate dehydrogenase-like beta-hydroxyacid dehydrogenase
MAETQIPASARVAFIGLGVMGRPMALPTLNVLRAGYDLIAQTRSPIVSFSVIGNIHPLIR